MCDVLNDHYVIFLPGEIGHALDEKSDGNPISDELLSLMNTLGKMTALAKNLTDEYKTKFNLLF